MNKRILLAAVISVTIISNLCAQSIILYKTSNGKLITSTQLDTLLAHMKQTYKNSGMTLQKQITGQEVRGDTIVYEFTFNATRQSAQYSSNLNSLYAMSDKFINQSLPAFKLIDLNGKVINSDDLKGKAVVLNFWFTTCLGCILEMPELNKMEDNYKDSNIVFIAMTFNDDSTVNKFLRKTAFNFIIIPNAKSYIDQFTSVFPLTIFVGRDGIIKNVLGGMPVMMGSDTSKTNKVDATEFISAINKIK